MPDLIQFECPACASTLRIPIELSGQDGPCPVCQNLIVAPNPYTGIGAYLAMAALDPSPPEIAEPDEPDAPAFADPQPQFQPPPQLQPEVEPEPLFAEMENSPAAPFTENQPFPDRLIRDRQQAAPEASVSPQLSAFDAPAHMIAPERPRSRKGLLVGAFALLALALLAAAFFLKDQLFSPPEIAPPVAASHPRIPPPTSFPSINPPPAPQGNPASIAPQAPPAAGPSKGTPEAAEGTPKPPQPQEAKPPGGPKKIVTAAETTLRAFLEAPDWASRSDYVLSPESVRLKMQAYAKENPDGPTAFTSFSVKHSQVDEKTGSTLFVFQVEAPGAPGGIPVAILETSKGWLVDWESFVEFRDDQFRHFTEGPVDLKGDFHLIVTAPQGPPGTAQENENFAGFTLSPPLPDRQRTAFVRKSSPAYQQLKEATAGGRVFTPVLEVAKRNANDKQSYLEILSIRATDWRPKEK